jgi:hypothetical protein
LSPPGLKTLTFQPVAGHYTDWAFGAHVYREILKEKR